ncbi:MAG: glycosyltransferase family 2 protein [Planctomycetota bacterium]
MRPEPIGVVVPCMNEEAVLPLLEPRLEDLRRSLAPGFDLRLVFVDDGSTDGTWAELERRFGDREDCRLVRHETNRGIAAAITSGIAAARTEYVGVIDADLSYDPALIARMIPHVQAGADLVTASPYHRDGGVEGVPGWRLALSKGASRLYRGLLRTDLATYTSCVRLYRRSAVAGLAPRDAGFVGVTELLALVDRRGGKIVEIPARLGARQAGVSKMRTLKTVVGHLGLMGRVAAGRLGEPHA